MIDDVAALYVDRNGPYPARVTGGEWTPGALAYEWTCYVEQWRYGHRAKKATWLYYRGFRKPFDLKWGYLDPKKAAAPLAQWRGQTRAQRAFLSASVSQLALWRDAGGRLHGSALPKLGKKEAISTPLEFLDVLLALARWAVAA